MSDSSDFIVVGGGVMGLMLARYLLSASASVTLLEAGQCGREASWAGGGIVSPLYPWRYAPAVTRLSEQAWKLFPALCAELYDETGIDAEYSSTGMLMLDAPDAEQALQWSAAHHIPVQALSAQAIRAIEPTCADSYSSALWMPQVANVRNPRLIKALLASVKRFPHFQLREFEPVLQVEEQGSSAVTVSSALRSYKASQVIVCAGAWSARLLKRSGVSLPVKPVCGQMLLYRLKLGLLNHLPLQRIVLHEGRYLIPRRDGHILAGSTLEHRGFNKEVTAEALASLKTSAEKLMPALRGIEPVQHWAGLRPGSPEGIPVMGQITSGSAVWVCAGHFRNGLVLSPASTRLMADLVLKQTPVLDPLPYAVNAVGVTHSDN